MKAIRIISRLILGAVFLFSGFVKAIDPLGSAYKFGDYFQAFGMDFLDALSLPLGIFLASFEMVLGLVLILGYQKKSVYWILLVFMTFFTLLTFILALTNPVTDCGCFGDAVILTNWQTFLKNVVLMLFVLILFSSRRNVENIHRNEVELLLVLLFFAGGTIMSGVALRHLPFIDFRPYDIGTNIPSEMAIPDNAPVDEYETILYYKNLETGATESFGLEDYPRDTSVYAFVTSESELVSKGYEPPIHDFGILDPQGDDVTDQVLNFEGYTLLMVSYDLEESDGTMLSMGTQWSQLDRISSDFKFLPVTASAGEILEKTTDERGLDFTFYAGDETMLKTLIRSNPGFVLIKNGTIIGKWAGRDFPEMEAWNSSWPEKIGQYLEEQDPEILMLIEQGYMEPLNIDLVDFDRSATAVTASALSEINVRAVWTIYFLVVVILIVALQHLRGSRSARV